MEIKIKNGVSVIYNLDTQDYSFLISTTDVEKVYELEPEYQLFIELLKDYSNVDEIYYLIKDKYPKFSKSEFLDNINILKLDGILSYDSPLPDMILPKEANRYK